MATATTTHITQLLGLTFIGSKYKDYTLWENPKYRIWEDEKQTDILVHVVQGAWSAAVSVMKRGDRVKFNWSSWGSVDTIDSMVVAFGLANEIAELHGKGLRIGE